MSNKFEADVDVEEDCITVNYEEDFEDKTLILYPITDARVLINRLNFLETYCGFLEDYLGYSSDDLAEIRSEAEYNTEMI